MRYYPYNYPNNNLRGGFFFPFLVGAVTGGAAVGLTRPRPIYSNYRPGPYYGPGYGYNYGYNYYYPTYY